MTNKIDFLDLFQSRTISFNTVILAVVYIITRFFPNIELNITDITMLQTVGNIILRFITNKPLSEVDNKGDPTNGQDK